MIEKIKQFYKTAKRTSLLAQEKINKKWFHLFSVIELQPEDEYPYYIPNHSWTKNCFRTKHSKLEEYTFYLYIDEITDIDTSINIFNNPLNNFEIDGQKISFFNSSFTKEPTGDYPLILAPNLYKTEGLSSVLPKRHSGLLVWCMIDWERITEKKFITTSVSKEMQSIENLTMEWLGFDIIQKKEHLGNIYFSAPNPYFRSVDVSLSTDPIGIFYKIKQRIGIFESLSFRITDKHGDSIALDKIYPVTNYIGLIELPHEPHLIELRFYNKENDLIAIHEPATFIKKIQSGISVKQADFHVKIETEKENKEFTVVKFSKPEQFSIGKIKEFNSEYYFKEAEKKRVHIELARKKEFIFYPGARTDAEKTTLKEDARLIVKEIINNANDTCYLCDPYFSSMDIIDFAFHVKNSGVHINILNCKEYIKKDEAKRMDKIVEEYNQKALGRIIVRTLRGKGILHDRFIITDTNVWFLGSSFNEFGSRATCIAKVPKSADVTIVKEIEKWFLSEEYSQSITEYTKEVSNE